MMRSMTRAGQNRRLVPCTKDVFGIGSIGRWLGLSESSMVADGVLDCPSI